MCHCCPHRQLLVLVPGGFTHVINARPAINLTSMMTSRRDDAIQWIHENPDNDDFLVWIKHRAEWSRTWQEPLEHRLELVVQVQQRSTHWIG